MLEDFKRLRFELSHSGEWHRSNPDRGSRSTCIMFRNGLTLSVIQEFHGVGRSFGKWHTPLNDGLYEIFLGNGALPATRNGYERISQHLLSKLFNEAGYSNTALADGVVCKVTAQQIDTIIRAIDAMPTPDYPALEREVWSRKKELRRMRHHEHKAA
jgi:hypothetical protein